MTDENRVYEYIDLIADILDDAEIDLNQNDFCELCETLCEKILKDYEVDVNG